MVMDNWNVDPTRPFRHPKITTPPFTLSSTMEELYMGHTAEAKPRLRPSSALQKRTHQKFDTRMATIGIIVATTPITRRAYVRSDRKQLTTRMSHFFEIQTPRGEPIVAITRIVEVNRL